MSTSIQSPVTSVSPGTYRFVVSSATEAVATIQAHLGPTARVLSVQNQPRGGLRRWFSAPRLEVVAELPEVEAPVPGPVADSREETPSAAPIDQMAHLARTGHSTAPAEVAALLRRAGFPEKLIARWQGRSPPGNAQPLHRVLADLGKDLRQTTGKSLSPLPNRCAFLGQAGVGRTTALCKWLAHETISQGRQGTAWKVEFDRPNPAPLLDVFGEAVGVPVEHYVAGSAEAPGEFLVVDLPAMSASDTSGDRALKKFLDDESIAGRILVLNALYAPDVLRSAYARGRDFGATHLVLTHLDELPRWGHLWEFLWEGELIPLFASTGPGLIGDIASDVLDHVLERTVPGIGKVAA